MMNWNMIFVNFIDDWHFLNIGCGFIRYAYIKLDSLSALRFSCVPEECLLPVLSKVIPVSVIWIWWEKQ